MTKGRITATYVLLLVTLVWVANMLTSHIGMIPAGFGLITTAGTYCAGATLIVRDLVHEHGGWKLALLAIGLGAAVTAITSPALALASGVTFLIAELVDLGIYARLRQRGYLAALLGSSLIGLLVDSVLFLKLAGFPVTAPAVAGQALVKTYAVALLSFAAWGWRALPGERQ